MLLAEGLTVGFAGPADDVAAIRALNDAYADAVFRRDAGDWGALWAEDAGWSLMGMQVQGREAIVALWNQAMAGFAFVGFFVQHGAIAVSGDRAEGRIWTNEVLETLDGTQSRPVGRYDDIYVRGGDGWRFHHRTFTLLKG